ncbi:hypothetical protein [Paludisphaera mucosa]|uniref:Tetratricopeptide repeat protein n=1 Tax=Paludisphaera mucosa TaxID=3030827 RepID=A0ABT6F5C1_9BACT|nr:hypothetical protein [Paludisphaera mucosa]MDG3002754.1 hypothetical protein [Paludisphaera mucosa]
MKDPKTPEPSPAATAVAEPGFPDLDARLDGGGPAEAIDRLVADLERDGNYRLLLDALLLKARHELGLPLIQVGRYADLPEADRLRFEERYVEALRHVGSRFLAAGEIPTAWAYFQAIGEPGPVAEALAALPTPDDPDRIGPLIDVAFHQGANPTRGFEWILRSYGPCPAITALEQSGPADPAVRTACVERLIRHLHESLVDNIRADVTRRGQPQAAAGAGIAELIAGRDWLFSDDAYHTDVSHLTTVVRWSATAADPEALRLALDLTEYGRRLSPRLQYDSAPPFERTFEDHNVYLKALTGRDVDAAVAHFRAKLDERDPSEDGDVQSTIPAQVLVNLLMRVGRQDEAVEVATEHLLDVPDGLLACPSIAELCQRSGRLDRLAAAAVRMKNPVHYLAARIQAGEAEPS